MKTFPAGLLIKLPLPLIDHDGEPVVPTGVAFTVSDLDDVLLVPSTRLDFSEDDTDAEVVVQGPFNELPAGAILGGRIVRLYMNSASGTHVVEDVYGLRPFQRLVPPRNSFVTDAAAQVLAGDIPNLTSFTDAATPEREAALIEAHARIVRVPLKSGRASDYRTKIYDRHSWSEVTAGEFRSLPNGLKRALMRAQLQEANQILANDPVRGLRRAGVVSETIGDASMTLRPIEANEPPASPEAMNELAGFIAHGAISPNSVEAII